MSLQAAPVHPFRILPPDAGAAPGPPGTIDLALETSAFGGGSHPTTISCLELLSSLAPLAGVRLLDLGSGSGILAIAALRLGAVSALCVDVNPDAVASARRNGLRNGVGDRLEHRAGTVEDLAGDVFDLVVANIGGELLLDQADRVAALVRPGGRLLLSGLLRGWAETLQGAYRALGYRALERRFPGEFCTILAQRA